MKQGTRIRVAAVVTTLFVGGLAVVGIALRGGGGSTAQEVAAPKPQVIHRTKVRRVPAKHRKPAPSKAPATPVSSSAPPPAAAPVVSAPAAQPAVVSAPPRVTSRTSPSGGGGGESEGGESESEHEGGGDD